PGCSVSYSTNEPCCRGGVKRIRHIRALRSRSRLRVMDALFGFLGNYWWLALVFGGAIASGFGALGQWWSKQSKQRHKQRLEVMRVKAEIAQANQSTDPEAIAQADAASRADRL